METLVKEPTKSKPPKEQDTTNKQIRGSSLLLGGRFISVGLNFASQVLMVRYLTKTDFGAYTYALAVVAFFHGLSSLGLRRGITRFIPIYHERDENEKLTGTIILTLSTIAITSIFIIGAIHLAPEHVSQLVKGKDQPVYLLLILIFMVPVEAIDGLLVSLFACFASPRAIFFRKFIVAPGLKLTVVLLLITLKSGVIFLAYGYLIGSALGVLFFVGLLLHMWYKQGVLQKLRLKTMNIPAKEIFAFTIPLLTSDLVTIIMHSADTMFLGYFHGSAEVAAYRVILPAAHFNKIPMMSFAILYTPLAARLFAKENFKGINDLYWRTAIWMSVLSFPIFALTFSLAKPVTVLLYGARYESSWFYMQLFALGYYFNVVLGFNGLTLKVLGKVRYVVILNIGASLCNLVLAYLLIPKFGALGAAVATTSAMIIHNVFKQAGLKLGADISIFEWQYFSFYLFIVAGALALFLIQFFTTQNVYVLIPLAGILSIVILRLSKDKLKIDETFPELRKIPGVRSLLKLIGF
ncbi:flippase [candidate division KSB1 bacterium]|nr:flippase [candidate division KSB1 bacterium]NIR69712.1 flippase [candidate division KSB1 bacterium]NIS24908.1 flippase [candidate division KSB1 bacterium]NIT69757.1 flippase [candidate division KSB1 bacterium]NIU23427.1 flippase [candidate division KSB1 bacterium]